MQNKKSQTNAKPIRVLSIASYDSFIRSNLLVSKVFRELGASVEHALLNTRSNQITDQQIELLGLSVDDVKKYNLDSLCEPEILAQYDVFLAALDGASFRRLFLRLESHAGPRPLIVALYPGLVLRYHFDGFSSRAPADFLWLNSKHDLSLYQSMCVALGADSSNAHILGPTALLAPVERKHRQNGPIVFFEQAVIPRSIKERQYLAQQLILLACRYPERQFLIKPRIKQNGTTLHRTKAHIEPLLRQAASEIGTWPENLKVVFDPVERLLSISSHCLTISSTVAVEAIHAGVPTSILTDFGVHDDLGVQFFFKSDLACTFEALDFKRSNKPNQKWLALHVTDPNKTIKDLVRKVFSKTSENRARKIQYRNTTPFYFSTDFRNHLKAKYTNDFIGKRSYKNQTLPPYLAKLLEILKRLLNRFK